MKIQFIMQHIVRGQTRAEDVVYEKDEVVDFGKDRVANSYAQAYVERGYAVEIDAPAARGGRKPPDADLLAAAEKAAADAAAKADADANAKAEADTKLAALQQQGGQQSGKS